MISAHAIIIDLFFFCKYSLECDKRRQKKNKKRKESDNLITTVTLYPQVANYFLF